jgi:hypothetical protein
MPIRKETTTRKMLPNVMEAGFTEKSNLMNFFIYCDPNMVKNPDVTRLS